jgi:hypothetical protein
MTYENVIIITHATTKSGKHIESQHTFTVDLEENDQLLELRSRAVITNLEADPPTQVSSDYHDFMEEFSE